MSPPTFQPTAITGHFEASRFLIGDSIEGDRIVAQEVLRGRRTTFTLQTADGNPASATCISTRWFSGRAFARWRSWRLADALG